MLAIAFYLAIVTFFIPKKYKQICGYVSMGIFVFLFVPSLLNLFFREFSFMGYIYKFFNFFSFGISELNPLRFVLIKFILPIFQYKSPFMSFIYSLIFYGTHFAIAYAATKVSIIKYKSDKEFEEGNYSEKTSDIVSTAADGRLLRVVEVNAGLCTGTLRGAAIEAKINKMAAEGWKFEQFESIIGRCCLIFARYKAVICFSKEK